MEEREDGAEKITGLSQPQTGIEAQIPGFKTIKEFLEYCKLHNLYIPTLISRQHAAALYDLAGVNILDLYDGKVPKHIEMPSWEMGDLLRKIYHRNPGIRYV